MVGHHFVSIVSICTGDAEGPTSGIAELANTVLLSFALDCNPGNDKIVGGISDDGFAIIGTQAVGFAAVFDDALQDVGGLIHSGMSFADVVEDAGARRGLEGGEGLIVCVKELVINGELEFTANCRDAANNFGAINWAGVPGVNGYGDGGQGGVEIPVVGGNGDGLVEVPEEPLNADGLVVASGGLVIADAEDGAHVLKDAGKGAACIDDDHATQPNFEQDMLKEVNGQLVRGDGGHWDTNDKLSEVAHARKELFTGAVVGLARAPQVTMKDEHGAGDGPAKGQVRVVTVGFVFGNAVSAAAHPGANVGALVGPEEAAFDAEASGVEAEMAARGVAVEGREDVLAQALGDINEEDVVLKAALVHKADAIVVQDKTTSSGMLAGLRG